MAVGNLKIILNRGDLTFFTSVIVVIILPVYVNYLPPFMILWGIFWLMENYSGLNRKMFIGNKAGVLFLLFILFYLWQISGLLFADSLDSGFERIFKRLSFFLFPLVLFFPGKRIIENANLLLRLFAIFTFIYLIFCVGRAFSNSLVVQDGLRIFNSHPADYDYENFFYSSRLSFPAHPSYVAMYTVLSMLISLEMVFDKSLNYIKRIGWLVIAVFLLFGIYLLSSRAGFLASAVVLSLVILKKLYSKYSKLIILFSMICLAILFFVIARTNNILNHSIESVTKENIDKTFKNDIRVMIWKSAMGVIGQNLILGVGTGDASEELKKEYIKRGYSEGFYDNLNAHNQYFDILLENGIIGLLIFLSVIGFMFYFAFSEQNYLYFLFLIIVIIFFFFETVLNRLAGITFFSLFSFLLIHYKPVMVKE